MKIKIDVELKNTQNYANCVFLFYHGLLAGNLKKKSAATIWKSTSLSVSMFFTAVKSRALEALVSPISLR
jgi:hypothetical protein